MTTGSYIGDLLLLGGIIGGCGLLLWAFEMITIAAIWLWRRLAR